MLAKEGAAKPRYGNTLLEYHSSNPTSKFHLLGHWAQMPCNAASTFRQASATLPQSVLQVSSPEELKGADCWMDVGELWGGCTGGVV